MRNSFHLYDSFNEVLTAVLYVCGVLKFNEYKTFARTHTVDVFRPDVIVFDELSVNSKEFQFTHTRSSCSYSLHYVTWALSEYFCVYVSCLRIVVLVHRISKRDEKSEEQRKTTIGSCAIIQNRQTNADGFE